jgi:hypothetical protein
VEDFVQIVEKAAQAKMGESERGYEIYGVRGS